MTKQPELHANIVPEATLAIYDRNTGEIIGYHHFAAAPGASIPDRKGMEATAVRISSRNVDESSASVEALAALFVEPNEIEQGKDYRVSADKRLIATRPDAADAPPSS